MKEKKSPVLFKTCFILKYIESSSNECPIFILPHLTAASTTQSASHHQRVNDKTHEDGKLVVEIHDKVFIGEIDVEILRYLQYCYNQTIGLLLHRVFQSSNDHLRVE